MKRSSVIWLIVVIVIIVIAGVWYWSYSSSESAEYGVGNTTTNTGAPMIPYTPSSTPAANATVVLNDASTTSLGTFLVAANGMTLYKYTPDTPGVSNCSGGCATAWPPYTISASDASTVLAGGSGIGGQIGTITRADGTIQVTYNGMPLYFYSKDQAVGDTKGQDVGGIWFVVAP